MLRTPARLRAPRETGRANPLAYASPLTARRFHRQVDYAATGNVPHGARGSVALDSMDEDD